MDESKCPIRFVSFSNTQHDCQHLKVKRNSVDYKKHTFNLQTTLNKVQWKQKNKLVKTVVVSEPLVVAAICSQG